MIAVFSRGGPGEWVILAVIGVVVIAAIALAIVFERKRKAALARACAAAGLACEFKPDKAAKERMFLRAGTLQSLRTGSKGLGWFASGPVEGREMSLLEHRYTVHHGKSSTTYYHLIASTPCPASWPELTLAREGIFDKLAELFGRKDMKVESEAFNRAWRVKCDSEDFALLVLSPQVQAWCMELPKGLWWAIGRGAICVIASRSGREEDVERFTRLCAALAGMLPEELEAWGAEQ